MSFYNPSGYWKHNDGFIVELTEEADLTRAPSSGVVISDLTVTVPNGRIENAQTCIQMYAEDEPFFWPYYQIKCIRRPDGTLIWKNLDHPEEIPEVVEPQS